MDDTEYADDVCGRCGEPAGGFASLVTRGAPPQIYWRPCRDCCTNLTWWLCSPFWMGGLGDPCVEGERK